MGCRFLCIVFVMVYFLSGTESAVCDMEDTYQSILKKCIPAMLNAALDDRASCESFDTYWTCVEKIAKECKLPIDDDIIETAKNLLKTVVTCSGTCSSTQCSITLMLFSCGFLIVRFLGKST